MKKGGRLINGVHILLPKSIFPENRVRKPPPRIELGTFTYLCFILGSYQGDALPLSQGSKFFSCGLEHEVHNQGACQLSFRLCH